MPKFNNYYVVEFRYPVEVQDAEGVSQAVSKALRMCERVWGFKPDGWHARVFEYKTGEATVGLAKEYFYNPNSHSYREIFKNIGYHQDMVEKGLTPDDIPDYDKIIPMASIDEEDFPVELENESE